MKDDGFRDLMDALVLVADLTIIAMASAAGYVLLVAFFG